MTRRKDRVLNTRIPEELDREIREQAERLDVSVSQFVRDVLHQTVDLVGNISGNVEHLVNGIVDDVGGFRNAGAPETARRAALAKEIGRSVLGWQEIRSNRDTRCPITGIDIAVGDPALLGIRASGRASVLVAPAALDELLGRKQRVWVSITLQQAVTCAESGEELKPGERAWFCPEDDTPEFISDEQYQRQHAPAEEDPA